MTWLYLILAYLVLAALLGVLTRDVRKSAARAALFVLSGGLLFNLLNPSGPDFRLALVFAAGLACLGGWALLTSLLSYDDALQERWDAAQAEEAQKRAAERESPPDESAPEHRGAE